jgi:hypothetical protein
VNTTTAGIRKWLEYGKENGATHLIVVCDTYDYTDYPVYVSPGEDVREVAEKHRDKNMQRVMEIYNLAEDWEDQLDEPRAFHY